MLMMVMNGPHLKKIYNDNISHFKFSVFYSSVKSRGSSKHWVNAENIICKDIFRAVFQSAASEVVLRNIELIRLVQKHDLECFVLFFFIGHALRAIN